MSMTRGARRISGRRSLTCFGAKARLWRPFDHSGDSPNKTEQLSTDSSDDLQFVFPTSRKFHIPAVKAILSLPGDVFDGLGQSFLPLQEKATHPWTVLISPSSFDNDTTQVRITGLSNPT